MGTKLKQLHHKTFVQVVTLTREKDKHCVFLVSEPQLLQKITTQDV